MAVSHFHRLLRAKIEEVIADHSVSITCGEVSDWATYKEATGYIRGLRDALRLCEDIDRDKDS